MLATTLSLAVIFAPIAFMSGQVGRFFNSFGFVVGFAILLSMIVSFTLTPMLCARFLRNPHPRTPPSLLGKGTGVRSLKTPHPAAKRRHPLPRSWGEGKQTGFLTRNYMRILGWSLRHRWVIVVATLLTFLSTPVLFMLVGSDFVPKDDQSEFEVAITLKEGTTLAAGRGAMRRTGSAAEADSRRDKRVHHHRPDRRESPEGPGRRDAW